MSTFPCPHCGEPVSLVDAIAPGVAACGVCWQHVAVPEITRKEPSPISENVAVQSVPDDTPTTDKRPNAAVEAKPQPDMQSSGAQTVPVWLEGPAEMLGGLLQSGSKTAPVWMTLLTFAIWRGCIHERPVNRYLDSALFMSAKTETHEAPTEVELLAVAPNATIHDVSQAYEPFFCFVETSYTTHTKGLFGESAQRSGIQGAGVLIAHDRTAGLIVTNRHVVDPNYFLNYPANQRFTQIQVEASQRHRSARSVKVIAIHRQIDLALLLVESSFDGVRAVPVLPTSNLRLGVPVVALGNPLGGYRARDGKVSSEPIGGAIEHSCLLDPGFSGGPLIQISGGDVIGINTSGIGRGGHYAILLSDVLDTLGKRKAVNSVYEEWMWQNNHQLTPIQAKAKALALVSLVPIRE